MKICASIILLVALIASTSCSRSPQAQIVGQWYEIGSSAVGVFHEDGTVELAWEDHNVSGRYSFITEGKIKIEVAGKGLAPRPLVYTISLDGDKMSWVDMDGEKTEYLKAK